MQTVRINELPPYSNLNPPDPLTINDKIPIWRGETNKTVQTDLATLKAFLVTGNSTIITPTAMGACIVVTPSNLEIGTNIFNIPSIAGKTFVLRRAGFGALLVGTQYQILSSGGFKLLPENNLITETDQFELELVDDTSSPSTSGNGSGGNLFTGAIAIASSLTLNSTNHLNKLLQLRAQTAGIICSLAKVEDWPENSIICIEAMINNTNEATVKTSNGQYIYFNGTSVLSINLRAGEYLWLYRGSDGYYVIAFSPSILQIGDFSWGYKVGNNELELNGNTYSKSAYARFWNWVNSLPYSVVDDTTWNTPYAYYVEGAGWTTAQPAAGTYRTVANPYRGCFADVDANTFRVPDFRNSAVRGLGTDNTKRFYNHEGGFQENAQKKHSHLNGVLDDSGNGGPNGIFVYGTSQKDVPGQASKNPQNENNPLPANLIQGITNVVGDDANETRMDNIGLKAKIKI